jgi:hypothetical protein
MTLHKLGFIIPENQNNLTTFDESLPNCISAKSVKQLMGYMGKSIHSLV